MQIQIDISEGYSGGLLKDLENGLKKSSVYNENYKTQG